MIPPSPGERTGSDPAHELWPSPVGAGEPLTEAHLTATVTVTVEVALAISSIDFPHGDPADHFLVLAANAKAFDLRLVTGDEHLIKLPGIRILANR
jgi:PIN domain nuclease of toxin-antitoxin system